jgi:N-acetylglucosamine-6-phosphate deacetylase
VTGLSTCVANAIRYAGVSLADVVGMVTANPSRLLALGTSAGHERLVAGMAANLTLFRLSSAGEVQVTATVVAGTVVYQAA